MELRRLKSKLEAEIQEVNDSVDMMEDSKEKWHYDHLKVLTKLLKALYYVKKIEGLDEGNPRMG